MSLKIEMIKRETEQVSFDCGVPRIQELMRDAFYATLLGQGHAYNVFWDNTQVAQFQISIGYIVDEDYSTSQGSNIFPCIRINYIAVAKEHQNKGIGTCVLNYAVRLVRTASKTIPIRYIVLEAFCDKVPWYRERGFVEFSDEKADPASNGYTIAMFMDLIDKDVIEEYQHSLE